MQTPNGQYPLSPTSVQSPMPNFIQDPSIRGLSFDQLLQNRGIRFIHKPATPCPNMLRLENNSHVPDCKFCNNTGMLYYAEREIVGVFQGNSLEKLFEQQGVWEQGSAILTLPSMYADGTQADFNTFDKLEIPDFEIRIWQLLEYQPTTNRQQTLRYPIISIDYISSIVNNTIKVYQVGVDFNITADGAIEWVYGRTPSFNAATGIGEVLTVTYLAHPVYLVLQSMRELRITQEYVNGVKIAKRLPQEVMIKRDFLVNPPTPVASTTIAQ
jgi:hypothetical protein